MEEKQELNIADNTIEVETEIVNDFVDAEVVEGDTAAMPNPKPKNKFLGKVDNFFGISKSGSNFKTEIVAGVTTFMAMAYILFANPGILGDTDSNLFSAFYIATALGAIVGTLLMSLMAKHPFAQAPGMGLNAFFAYTLVGFGCSKGLTVANGLFIVLISGVLFLILTLVGVREKIVECIPKSVRQAIPVGIGLFIAFIGLQNAKVIVGGSTLVELHTFNIFNINGGNILEVYGILIMFISLIAIAVMSKLKVKGAMIWGILGGTVLYYAFGWAAGVNYNLEFISPGSAFANWGENLVGQVFVEGWNFSGQNAGEIAMIIITGVLSFAMVDMFDTIGTLLGTAQRANMLDEKGNMPRMKQALLADSIATCTGAIFGTTTVTTFVESSAGVAEGGRTGMTSLVTAALFFVAMFLSPLAAVIPGCATAAALVYVGVLMMASIKNIDFSDVLTAVPAFLTIAMMAFTYNISYGIGLGLISHCLIMLGTGKYFGLGKEFVKGSKKIAKNVQEAVEVAPQEGEEVALVADNTINEIATIDNNELSKVSATEQIEGEENKLLPKTYYLKKECVTIVVTVVFILLFMFTH